MTKERFTDMIRYFSKFFPNYLKTENDIQEKADMLFEFFEDEELEVVYKAFILCIKNKPFFPDVSEINSKIKIARSLLESKKNQPKPIDESRYLNYTLESDWVFQLGVKEGF